ncbi:hypothetical protein [Martelella soudanensis]|uniref:hypothetical protein n=1 Tax=unclassified Martelella TaxID=2629616 RepID=UPI0015E03830|nr:MULTISPECIES: hypothetical protein [unclassified Martelella]
MYLSLRDSPDFLQQLDQALRASKGDPRPFITLPIPRPRPGEPRGVAAPEAGNNAAADNREPEIGRWHPVFHCGLRRYRFSRIPENGYPIRKRSQTAGSVMGRSCFAISEVVDYLYQFETASFDAR